MNGELEVFKRAAMDAIQWSALITMAMWAEVLPSELLGNAWKNGVTINEIKRDVERMYKSFH